MELKEALNKLKMLDDEIAKLTEVDTPDPRVEFAYQISDAYTTEMLSDKWYNVKLFIKPKQGFDMKNVEKVVFLLHPTFEPNVIVVDEKSNFTLNLESWGDFHAMAVVIFKDKSETRLIQYLPIGVEQSKQS